MNALVRAPGENIFTFFLKYSSLLKLKTQYLEPGLNQDQLVKKSERNTLNAITKYITEKTKKQYQLWIQNQKQIGNKPSKEDCLNYISALENSDSSYCLTGPKQASISAELFKSSATTNVNQVRPRAESYNFRPRAESYGKCRDERRKQKVIIIIIITIIGDSMIIDTDHIPDPGLPPIPEMAIEIEENFQDQIPEMVETTDKKVLVDKDQPQETGVTDKDQSPLPSMDSEHHQNLRVGIQYLKTEVGIEVLRMQLIKIGVNHHLKKDSKTEKTDGRKTEMETGEEATRIGMIKCVICKEDKRWIFRGKSYLLPFPLKVAWHHV